MADANKDHQMALGGVIVGALALIIAIPALVIAGLANQTTDTSNTQNISAVAGTTNMAGDVAVSGNLTVTKITPSSSTTTGSIVTAGGLGVAGQIFSGLGIYTPVLDALGVLLIGTHFQTGITMGRTGLPITLNANQVTVNADMTNQHIAPITTSTYDLGNANQEWRNVFIGGNVYNVTNFPIKPSGGIYSMTSDGMQFNSGNPPTNTSILGTTGETSLPVNLTIPAGTMTSGDAWGLKAAGNLIVTANTSVTIALYIDGLVATQCVLPTGGAGSGYWGFNASFSVRNAGVNGLVRGSSQIAWNNIGDQDITTLQPIDTTTDMLWDLRASISNAAVLTTFQCLQCNIQKIF